MRGGAGCGQRAGVVHGRLTYFAAFGGWVAGAGGGEGVVVRCSSQQRHALCAEVVGGCRAPPAPRALPLSLSLEMG